MKFPRPPCSLCYDRHFSIEVLLTKLTASVAALPSWDEFVRMDPIAHASAKDRAWKLRWTADQLVNDLERLTGCCAGHWTPMLAAALQLRTAARVRDRCGMDLSLSLQSPLDQAAAHVQAAFHAFKADCIASAGRE